MYTIDDDNKEYEDEYLESSFWDNNKGMIIKIIIIILCIIVLIWLFKALKTAKNTTYDENAHIANIEEVRLAAEDYFFIQGNKSDNEDKVVNLSTLKDKGLISDIVDGNNKVCNANSTNVKLANETDSYKMTIKLVCSTNDPEENFYYHNNTLACLNCGSNTKMTGEETKQEEVNEGNKDVSNVIPVSDDEYSGYSCVNWSDWTKNRINDKGFIERSKTLVQGVKYTGSVSKTSYGDWTDYTTTPITATKNLEVEKKVVNENVWSNNKTARNIDPNKSNIKIIKAEVINDTTNSCVNGYVENNTCYGYTKIGNLTYKEYNSGKYRVQNNLCDGVRTLKNGEGKYVLTYVNCRYNEILGDAKVNYNSYTLYTYQELESKEVTYYRARMVTVVNEDVAPVYTKEKYEEKDLPNGYVKVANSEETYYSYKLAYCEK